MVIEVKDNKLEIGKGKALVDCYATWCGPCRMLAPVIEELSTEIKDYTFYKVDVDENEEIARDYGIMSIPTLLIFENGELKEKIVGLRSKNELIDLLK